MKRFFRAMKSVSLILAMTVALAGCSKDDEGDELNGTWLFQEVNYLYYIDGQVYYVEDEVLEESNANFRGMFFIFNNGSLSAGMGGQTYPWGTYTASGNRITIKDGATTSIIQYRISGKKMDLIFNTSFLEMTLGGMPDELYDFDEIEVVLSFKRVD
jgi:hypothetical protein